MVGIVVVAHSYPLATAAVELARQMVGDQQVRVAVAAGVDQTTPGTDATQIQRGIEQVDDPDGVLVLMDLGSAVLSAEMALELLEPPVRSRVLLCPAPLVEGLIAATVTAGGGGTLAEVATEAVAALAGKQSHLAAPEPEAGATAQAAPTTSDQAPAPAEAESAPAHAATAPGEAAEFVLANPHGLHARPAARLVAEVRALPAQVTLRNLSTGTGPVAAASLSRVATLGAQQGHRIEVTATGPEARTAVERVLALAGRGFDDTAPATAATPPVTATGSVGPLPASPGVGIGPAWTPEPAPLVVPERPAADPATEWRRLTDAIEAVRGETARLRERTARELGEAEAGILEAHLLLLEDAELLDQVRQRVDAGGTAETAWAEAIEALIGQMTALDDAYQRARAADVRGVGDQVLRTLLAVTDQFESRPGVLLTGDLTPAEASRLDPGSVAGIVLAHGSPVAHSAILARTLAIPMVVAAGPQVHAVPEGTTVVLDGGTGDLIVDPDPGTLQQYRARAAEQQRRRSEARALASQPARTRDEVTIEVAANLGSVADAEQALAAGADAAGLVRTEFLFLNRPDPPDSAEQERAYRALAEALDGRRITIRTLDVGGDKPLPYLPAGQEANPFLGVRGIRLSLARPDLLREQLRAACRVAQDTPVSLMFPMVSTVGELRAARELLDDVIAAEGGRRPAGLAIGIMVEVPAAALNAAAFTPYVDFFSIGTNDLTQYTLAAERGNGAVAPLADALDPAVLRLVGAVCQGAGSRVTVAVCGEAASDPTAIPLLIGLGVRELSVVVPAVPEVKHAVREVDTVAAARLARTALDAAGPAEVRALVTGGG